MKDQIVDMLKMAHPWQPEWVVTSCPVRGEKR